MHSGLGALSSAYMYVLVRVGVFVLVRCEGREGGGVQTRVGRLDQLGPPMMMLVMMTHMTPKATWSGCGMWSGKWGGGGVWGQGVSRVMADLGSGGSMDLGSCIRVPCHNDNDDTRPLGPGGRGWEVGDSGVRGQGSGVRGIWVRGGVSGAIRTTMTMTHT